MKNRHISIKENQSKLRACSWVLSPVKFPANTSIKSTLHTFLNIRNASLSLIIAWAVMAFPIAALGQATILEMKEAAAAGDASAQFRLGTRYGYGIHVPKDLKESSRLLRAAADQGHSLAQYQLGKNYLDGRGVEKSTKEGLAWLRKSGEEGYLAAQMTLGRFLDRGEYGIEANPTEAVKWYEKAAERGEESSQRELSK